MDHGSEDSNLVFMAGQTAQDDSKGVPSKAVIACMSLEHHLTLLTEHVFQNPIRRAASSIKRLRPKSNEMLVGVNMAIIVVDFSQGKFSELMIFDKIHSGRLV